MDFQNDPDSAELLMAEFEEDFEKTEIENLKEIPFSKCETSFKKFKEQIIQVENFHKEDVEIFRDKFENFGEDEEDLDIIGNVLIQNIQQKTNQTQIHECIQMLCSILEFSQHRSKIEEIIKDLNLILGPLQDTKLDDFHLNLQAKFALLHCEKIDIFNINLTPDLFSGILLNSLQVFENCPCVKNLVLLIHDKMTPKIFWNYVSNLFLSEEQFAIKSEQDPEKFSFLPSKDAFSWSFFWTFISAISDDLDDFNHCLNSIEGHLKNSRKDSKVHLALETLEKITEKSPLSLDILYSLWDIFREQINRNLQRQSCGSLDGFAILPQKYEEYVKSENVYLKNPLTKFAHLIFNHLGNVSRPDKEMQRLLTRFRQRLKLAQLSDIGIHNFNYFMLKLYKLTKENGVIKTYLEMVKAGLQTQEFKCWPLICKGLAASIVLLHDQNMDSDLLANLVQVLVKDCLEYCLRGSNLGLADASLNSTVSKVIRTYLSLLKDLTLRCSPNLLSTPNLISILTLKHVEKAAKDDKLELATEILQTFSSLCMSFKRYYVSISERNLSEEDFQLRLKVDEVVAHYFKADSDVMRVLDALRYVDVIPIKDRADLIMALIILNGFHDEAIVRRIENFLLKGKLTLALELLNELIQMEYPDNMEVLFLRTWIRLEMRFKGPSSITFDQLQSNMKAILEKKLGYVKTVQDWITNLGQEIKKSNYDQQNLLKIRDENSLLLQELTNTADPPHFNEKFYEICGHFIQQLSPLLWADGRKLLKIISPLTSNLIKEEHLKSSMIKNYSKLLPKLLIGIAQAIPDFRYEISLHNLFKEVVANGFKKMNTFDLEATFKVVFGQANIMIQKVFLSELRILDHKYRKIHLHILSKCLDISKLNGTPEVILSMFLPQLLDLQICNGAKDCGPTIVTMLKMAKHKTVISGILQDRIRKYFQKNYVSLKELLFIVQSHCPEVYRGTLPIIHSCIGQIEERNPVLAKRAKLDLIDKVIF